MNASLQTQVKAKPASLATPSRAATGLLQRKCACGGAAGVDGDCAECHKKRLQRQPAGPAEPTAVPPIVHEVLRSSGQPLDPATRAFIEPRFGLDFSAVRVHTDAKAAESARAVNALAYTVGSDVVFGAGQYRPESQRGQFILAHELAHVVQQNQVDKDGDTVGMATAHCEAEADAVAWGVISGQRTPVQGRMVQRYLQKID